MLRRMHLMNHRLVDPYLEEDCDAPSTLCKYESEISRNEHTTLYLIGRVTGAIERTQPRIKGLHSVDRYAFQGFHSHGSLCITQTDLHS